MLPNVGFGELALIFTVGLLLFGGDRLPKVARGLGEALRAFREELRRVTPTELGNLKDKGRDDAGKSGV